jgi:predicted ATPase
LFRTCQLIWQEPTLNPAISMTLGVKLMKLSQRWKPPRKGGVKADIHRIAGEIALMSPAADAARAQAHFEHALTTARQQQAKSWQLRAAMSLARRWRDQGKRNEARELLAPVYEWFTEGFDTLDLKEAKALLDTLVS